MGFVDAAEREALLNSIEETAIIVENADMAIVHDKLNTLKSVTFQDVQTKTFKIGSSSYDFDRIAF
jgi:hypothetical protein